MLDIKSSVLVLGVITTLLIVSASFNDLKNEMSLNKAQMEHMNTQMELMKEFHSNTQETLELETSNRLR